MVAGIELFHESFSLLFVECQKLDREELEKSFAFYLLSSFTFKTKLRYSLFNAKSLQDYQKKLFHVYKLQHISK